MRQSAKEKEIPHPHIPLTLALSPGGEPLRWIDYEDVAYYKSRNAIVWTLGKREYMIRGGINAKTMAQSTLSLESIVAVRNDSGRRRKHSKAALSNTALFNRDHHTCAYCDGVFPRSKLTRDHVIPVSKGGPDVWENVVTCCFNCNQRKGNSMLSELDDMMLLYKPYSPSLHEKLILDNKHITDDQLAYLMIGVSPHSRVYKDYQERIKKINNGEVNEFA